MVLVRVRKEPPSTTKGNVCVRPDPNVNPSFVPVRDPTTPAPTSTVIDAERDATKTEVRAGRVIVKIIVRKEPFTDTSHLLTIMDASTRIPAFTAIS